VEKLGDKEGGEGQPVAGEKWKHKTQLIAPGPPREIRPGDEGGKPQRVGKGSLATIVGGEPIEKGGKKNTPKIEYVAGRG